MEISLGDVSLNCPGEKSQWWEANSSPGNSSTLVFSDSDHLFEIERGKELFCGQKSQNGKSWKIFLKIKGQSWLQYDGASLPLMGGWENA